MLGTVDMREGEGEEHVWSKDHKMPCQVQPCRQSLDESERKHMISEAVVRGRLCMNQRWDVQFPWFQNQIFT